MATVYLVSRGADEDYSVRRIFSTREKAEAWIGPCGEEYQVEEFGLDAGGEERPMLVHRVVIDLETGEEAERGRGAGPRVAERPNAFRSETFIVPDSSKRPGVKRYVVASSSVSRDHAFEAGNAKRQQWLAELAQAGA